MKVYFVETWRECYGKAPAPQEGYYQSEANAKQAADECGGMMYPVEMNIYEYCSTQFEDC